MLQLERVVEVLQGAESQVPEFSEYLFTALVEKVVIESKESVKVRFKDGRKVTL